MGLGSGCWIMLASSSCPSPTPPFQQSKQRKKRKKILLKVNEYSLALCPRTISLFHLLSAATWQHWNSVEGTVMIWYFGWIPTRILTFLKGCGKAEAQRPWHPQPWITALALAPTQSMNQAPSVNSFMSFSFFVEKLRLGLLTCILLRTRSCSVVQHLVPGRTGFESQLCHLPTVWPVASYLISLCLGFLTYKMEIMLVQKRMKAVVWRQGLLINSCIQTSTELPT